MALTQVNGGMLDSVAQQVGFRNRIINGAMMIDQRNAGAAVTTSASYPVDRTNVTMGVTGATFSSQQSSTAPSGFVNSLYFSTGTGASPGASESAILQQRIEGLNVADLAWGTSSAATVTLSFWVRSSLTGTFAGSLRNSASNRSYVFTYTISSANTWEQKAITIAGDTTGTWLTTNGIGIRVTFDLGSGSDYNGTAGAWSSGNYYRASGSVNVIGTSSAAFYITGVQLEKGSTATSFDYRPYGTELALCQRYYQYIGKTSSGNDVFASGFTTGTSFYGIGFLKTSMRSAPTLSYTGSISDITFTYPANQFTCTGISASTTNTESYFINLNNASATTNGYAAYARIITANTALTFSAEL